MARRPSEKLATDAHLIVNVSGYDERELRLWRTIVGTEKEEVEDDRDVCTWSQLHTPIQFNVEKMEKSGVGVRNELRDNALLTSKSKRGQTRSRICKLPLLSGFLNTDALQAQLPRSASDNRQFPQGSSTSQDTCKFDADSKRLAQSRNIMQAHDRSRKLERKLPDVDETIIVEKANADFKRKHDVMDGFYAIAITADEVEASRRKWNLERQLQDSTVSKVPADLTSGSNQNPFFKREVDSLKFFAKEMPFEAYAKSSDQLGDVEKRRTDKYHRSTLGAAANRTIQTGISTRKLPALSPFTMITPAGFSIAEVKTKQHKCDLEWNLQNESGISLTDHQTHGYKPKLEKGLAINRTANLIDSAEARQRNWVLKTRLQSRDFHVTNLAKQQISRSPEFLTLHHVASFATSTEARRPTREAESKLCRMGDLDYREQQASNDGISQKLELQTAYNFFAASRGNANANEMSESLVYCLLFLSSAVLHSAIFTFNLELRQFLRLDSYPIGTVLLFSWIIVDLIHFVGGLAGDLVRDRVLLLRRTAILWFFAVVVFHVAAFQMSSLVSSLSLTAGFIFAGVAHGVICPNVIALGIESKLYCYHVASTPPKPRIYENCSHEEAEDSSSKVDASYLSTVSTASSGELQQQYDFVSHRFFSGCCFARLASSAFVQGYFHLFVKVSTYSDDEMKTAIASQGFHFMLLMSFGLIASLIYFCFKSGDFYESEKHRIKRNSVQGISFAANISSTWRWTNLCSCALVKNALFSLVLVTLISAGFALVVVVFTSQTSLFIRLAAFLLTVLGWLLTLVASSHQLLSTKNHLRRSLRERQLYVVLMALAFVGVAVCVAFLRAQIYTTMVVQVCQTQLLIPGTENTLFNPELLGVAVGTSSLAFLGFSRALSKRTLASESLRSKTSVFASPTLRGSVIRTTARQYQLPSSIATCPPATRMCFAMLLYLISVFLASVIELYRRQAGESLSLVPRSCGARHSEFTFLWTLPYVVLMGASDALFRVSFQELCHALVRGDATSSTPSLPSHRWHSTVQGIIALAETLGYIAALSLAALLSRWLYQPKLTDMALFFLLLTTVVALTHAMLTRIAAQAQAFQRLY